jgi:hypothetical protein
MAAFLLNCGNCYFNCVFSFWCRVFESEVVASEENMARNKLSEA